MNNGIMIKVIKLRLFNYNEDIVSDCMIYWRIVLSIVKVINNIV